MSQSSGNPHKADSFIAGERRPQQPPAPQSSAGPVDPQETAPPTPPTDKASTAPISSQRPGEPASQSDDAATRFWLLPNDRWFVGMLVLVAFLLMSVHWARMSGWGLYPVEIDRHPTRRYEYQIDINNATWVEWVQMDGIGEVLARRIIENRDTNGPFESIDDLRRVKGIGPKTLKKFRRYLTIEKDPNSEGG